MSEKKDIEWMSGKLDEVLSDVNSAKNILFGEEVAAIFSKGYSNFKKEYKEFKKDLSKFLKSDKNKNNLIRAGLSEESDQLVFKIKSFDLAYSEYVKKGGVYYLNKVLEIASIIFGSLGKALEEVGSYIQEFIAVVRFYLSKHLEKKVSQ